MSILTSLAISLTLAPRIILGAATLATLCNRTIHHAEHIEAPRPPDPIRLGSPLACHIHIKVPDHMARDHVAKIDFIHFKVGELKDGHCGHTYFVIQDGRDEDYAGRFCGENDQIQTYFAEFSKIQLMIKTDHYDDLIDFEFDISFVPKTELPERFGPRPDLFPDIRGNLVANTFCERVFQDCSRTKACYVQSPGYPGIYPRNLNCRFYLSTKQPYIKLYSDRLQANSLFDVSGRDCDSLVTCPFHSIGERDCLRDYVKIYDGLDEFSPLIGTFCGVGEFPSSIVGTGNKLFLEFSSTRDGALIGSGFDLMVGHVPGKINSYNGDGLCNWTFKSENLEASGEGIFLSLDHWYPPNTNCSYLIQGKPHEIARLYFPSMKITRIRDPLDKMVQGDCLESLTIYDDTWANGAKIIKSFCDSFSVPSENHNFISSGNSLFVEFQSATGSYSGSSIQFWAQYDFFDNRHEGNPRPGSMCDEYFVSTQMEEHSGNIRSPWNTLVFKPEKDRENRPISCNYDVYANPKDFSRINMNIVTLNLHPPESDTIAGCRSGSADRLEIYEDFGREVDCLFNGSKGSQERLHFVSRGPHVQLKLAVDPKTSLLYYFKSTTPLFTASFKFVHPPLLCGPYIVMPDNKESGSIEFPRQIWDWSREVTCVWDIKLATLHRRHRPEILLETAIFNFTVPNNVDHVDNCLTAQLEVRIPGTDQPILRECGERGDLKIAGGRDVLVDGDQLKGQEQLEVIFHLAQGVRGFMKLNFSHKIP